MTNDPFFRLRFFFDYGAGGCLWADNENALKEFGYGPIDEQLLEKGLLSRDIFERINFLDDRSANYLNKEYPLDPSPWTKAECDEFNLLAGELLIAITTGLGDKFKILNNQAIYSK